MLGFYSLLSPATGGDLVDARWPVCSRATSPPTPALLSYQASCSPTLGGTGLYTYLGASLLINCALVISWTTMIACQCTSKEGQVWFPALAVTLWSRVSVDDREVADALLLHRQPPLLIIRLLIFLLLIIILCVSIWNRVS